jgi:hypothetical protein
MGTFRQMAGIAADPVVELELVRNPSPLLHAILALLLLLVATVLATYKPFGMTPFAPRQQPWAHVGPQSLSATTVQAISHPTSRRWEPVFWIVGLTILGLIIVSHLLGAGTHGH